MVITREYIVVLPFTVNECLVAQKWHDIHKATGEVLKSEPYVNRDTGEKGHYTKRLCCNDSRTPGFIRSLAPAGSLDMYEERWESAAHSKSVLTNGYLKDKFNITIRTVQLPDTGTTGNPHKLPHDRLKNVEKVVINIANGESCRACNSDMHPVHPSKFFSVKTGRGKLRPTWVVDTLNSNVDSKSDNTQYGKTPLMCCYVLVDVEVKVFGLQSKLEKNIQSQTKQLLMENYQQMFCSIDSWYGLSLSDIDNIKNATNNVKQR